MMLNNKIISTHTHTHTHTRPSEFQQLPRETKVQILLGKQIGCQTAEGYIDGHVKRFLKKAWKIRSPFVRDNNNKYGRHDLVVKGS